MTIAGNGVGCVVMDALHALAPISDRYAHVPVAEAFDWTDAAGALGAGEWYLVAFRSVRRTDADVERLEQFDDLAHAEASTAPGFVHYFKGPADVDGSCLSFCLWDSRADARAAAGLPAHRAAVELIREMYDSYTLEFLRVSGVGAGRPLTFEPYDVVPASAPIGSHPVPSPYLPVPAAAPA